MRGNTEPPKPRRAETPDAKAFNADDAVEYDGNIFRQGDLMHLGAEAVNADPSLLDAPKSEPDELEQLLYISLDRLPSRSEEEAADNEKLKADLLQAYQKAVTEQSRKAVVEALEGLKKMPHYQSMATHQDWFIAHIDQAIDQAIERLK